MKHPLIFIIPVVLLSFAACKKLSDPSQATAITNEESALMIAGSLASGSNGLATLSTDISLTAQNLYSNSGSTNGCGAIHVDSLTHQSTPSSTIAYNFKNKITNKLNCNANNLADNVTSNLTFNGNYNGPKLSANGGGTANATVAGLTATSTVYAINGQLKSTSGFKLKADTTRNGTIAIDIIIKNLIIAKPTVSTPATITSGTATVTITGNSTKGAFLFSGTITFNGYNDATLVLGDTAYTINLSTGNISKK